MTSPIEVLQSQIIRAMTPSQRLEAAAMLYQTAWDIKCAALRYQHPAWSPAEIQAATRRIFITGYAGH